MALAAYLPHVVSITSNAYKIYYYLNYSIILVAELYKNYANQVAVSYHRPGENILMGTVRQ